MDSIFDGAFNGQPCSEMYRAQVVPELFPDQPRMRVENWPAEDRAYLVGGEEAKAFYRNEILKRAA
ncbi:hypothetical protein KIV66_gp46 [Mycobacterium phage MyraDee]|uniref:Uncharacterized protein n=1 Tax=Mycobacterium phage MyraDee TaxID=2024303 RepID=A0A222YZA3_9CAUD|nr:hypothetical protein KIV66_gp46 [Mycobacterium phage MyraDee]ASR77154.1 hypothetical protein SEA_MYRADEE_46 [Mycobacterium phage MyraDee]